MSAFSILPGTRVNYNGSREHGPAVFVHWSGDDKAVLKRLGNDHFLVCRKTSFYEVTQTVEDGDRVRAMAGLNSAERVEFAQSF